MMENPHVIRAIRMCPDSPLVEYTWPHNRMKIIAERASDINKQILHPSLRLRSDLRNILRPKMKRATLYEGTSEETTITDEDVDEAVAGAYDDEFAQILENEPFTDLEYEESLAEEV